MRVNTANDKGIHICLRVLRLNRYCHYLQNNDPHFSHKNTNNRKKTFSSSDINLVKKFWPHDICTMISKKKFQSVNYLPESFRQQTMTQHVSFDKTKSRSATQNRVQIYCWPPGLGCLQSFRQAKPASSKQETVLWQLTNHRSQVGNVTLAQFLIRNEKGS